MGRGRRKCRENKVTEEFCVSSSWENRQGKRSRTSATKVKGVPSPLPFLSPLLSSPPLPYLLPFLSPPPSRPQTLQGLSEGPLGSAAQLVPKQHFSTPQCPEHTLPSSPPPPPSLSLARFWADPEGSPLEIPNLHFKEISRSSAPSAQAAPPTSCEASVVNRPSTHHSPSQKPKYEYKRSPQQLANSFFEAEITDMGMSLPRAAASLKPFSH